ncbi:hypothetical protein ATG71_3310 [Bacillus sp. es.034]|jgi:hypothetical protein|nr:hypothetical protein ATG71_3310 [Bacillus sp. es.034]
MLYEIVKVLSPIYSYQNTFLRFRKLIAGNILMNESRGGTSMSGASGAVLFIIIPLLIIAVIIGITIGYFRKKARKNRNF